VDAGCWAGNVIVNVPAGAEATVILAGADAETTRLDDSPVSSTKRPARVEATPLLVDVGSGRHEFTWNAADHSL
jgi:hypothetical protein